MEVKSEGCLAWSIVFATFMIHVLQSGFSDSFGLILPAIKETFQVSNTEASLANSLVVFIALGSSPLSAWLCRMLGHRMTMVTGVVMASAGLLSAGLYIDYSPHQPNILVLYLTVGLLTGLGFGLTYLPSITILKMHFDRKLGLACGLAASGTGFGQFLLAPVVSIMLENYDLAATLYFFATIFFASLFFCLIYKPPNIQKQNVEEDERKSNFLESFISVVKTPSKLLFVSHAFLLNLCIYAVFTFFAERAISFGINETNASYLLSLMGLANFGSRIMSGVIVDKFRGSAFLILFSVHVINSLNILLRENYFLQNIGSSQDLNSAIILYFDGR